MEQTYKPGDFILIHGTNWYNRLIQFGQALRYHGKDKPYAQWTHVALIVDSDGYLIEALGNGIVKSHISKYKDFMKQIVHIEASNEDRQQAVAFAYSQLGDGYGWFTIVSIVFSLLTATKFSFNIDGQEICSGLVARALERTNYIPKRDASHISPCELAKQFTLEPL